MKTNRLIFIIDKIEEYTSDPNPKVTEGCLDVFLKS